MVPVHSLVAEVFRGDLVRQPFHQRSGENLQTLLELSLAAGPPLIGRWVPDSAASLRAASERGSALCPRAGLWEQAQPGGRKRSAHAESVGHEARRERPARGHWADLSGRYGPSAVKASSLGKDIPTLFAFHRPPGLRWSYLNARRLQQVSRYARAGSEAVEALAAWSLRR